LPIRSRQKPDQRRRTLDLGREAVDVDIARSSSARICSSSASAAA
jgi:hypothetical protein